MTSLGLKLAKPPVSPHENLVAVERLGANKQGSAIWRLACACGETLQANAFAIRRGAAHCRVCNPNYGDKLANAILAVLPATIPEIVDETGMTLNQVKFRLRQMKPALCHTGRWRRPRGPGALQPVIYVGPGEDEPCRLKPTTVAERNRAYRRRVKRAIERAAAGGKGDVRYTRHIGRAKADATAARTRIAPQTWFSVLTQ